MLNLIERKNTEFNSSVFLIWLATVNRSLTLDKSQHNLFLPVEEKAFINDFHTHACNYRQNCFFYLILEYPEQTLQFRVEINHLKIFLCLFFSSWKKENGLWLCKKIFFTTYLMMKAPLIRSHLISRSKVFKCQGHQLILTYTSWSQ